jgi:hypothetical protein
MAKRQLNVSVPALIDTKEFHPTCTMQKVLWAHLKEISNPECDKVTNPAKILAKMGHDRSNWYKWQKQTGFWEWWNKAIEEELEGGILNRVYANLAKLAMTQRDSSVIKLFLERFDKKYKPATRQEYDFAGYPPPEKDVQAATERSEARRKHIDSQQVEQTPDNRPANITESDNCADTDTHTPLFRDGRLINKGPKKM